MAGETGQGAIVAQDTPVYDSPTATESRLMLRRGMSVAALTGDLQNPEYTFPQNLERVRVSWLASEGPGKFDVGWVEARHLVTFHYPCCCGADPRRCSPLYFVSAAGQVDWAWNACFQQARDAKQKSLPPTAAAPQTTAEAPAPSAGATMELRADPGVEVVSLDGKPVPKKRSFNIQEGEHTLVVEETVVLVTTHGETRQGVAASSRLVIRFTVEAGKIYVLSGGPSRPSDPC